MTLLCLKRILILTMNLNNILLHCYHSVANAELIQTATAAVTQVADKLGKRAELTIIIVDDVKLLPSDWRKADVAFAMSFIPIDADLNIAGVIRLKPDHSEIRKLITEVLTKRFK